jgi:hypothetical protein
MTQFKKHLVRLTLLAAILVALAGGEATLRQNGIQTGITTAAACTGSTGTCP